MNHLIGLGSNWRAKEQIEKMLSRLKALNGQLWVSRIEKTAACGEDGHPCYFNAVAVLQTTLSPRIIRLWCKTHEKQLGRGKQKRAFICEADFDWLLSWEGDVHPDITEISEPYYESLVGEAIKKWAASFL